jgi:hypothetical protein
VADISFCPDEGRWNIWHQLMPQSLGKSNARIGKPARRLTEQIVLDDGIEAATWMAMPNKSYDLA